MRPATSGRSATERDAALTATLACFQADPAIG